MNEREVEAELLALALPGAEYVVVGGAVLALLGIRDTEDIDLVVSERLFADLQDRGWRVKTRPNGKPGLKHGRTEAYLDVNCESFERSSSWLFENAQEVRSGFPVVDLETLAQFKAGYGRPKDLQDLVLIRRHLSSS